MKVTIISPYMLAAALVSELARSTGTEITVIGPGQDSTWNFPDESICLIEFRESEKFSDIEFSITSTQPLSINAANWFKPKSPFFKSERQQEHFNPKIKPTRIPRYPQRNYRRR